MCQREDGDAERKKRDHVSILGALTACGIDKLRT
jgi:hypothetical protein